MSDRIRGALFNTLGDIEGLTLLDAFAGSGAIGIEAVSRGVSFALMIDNERPAQQAIAANIQALGVDAHAKLVQASCSGWSDTNPDQRFDLLIADPPYDDLQIATIQKMARHVTGGGIYVISWPGGRDVPEIESFERVGHKTYGDAQLFFLRRIIND